VAAAAHDEQVRVRRGVDQHLRRSALDDVAAHQPAVAGIDDVADRLFQGLLGTVLEARVRAWLRSAIAVGTVTASTASTPSSAATSSRQARNASSPAAAVVFTGPATAAPKGSSLRSLRWWAWQGSRHAGRGHRTRQRPARLLRRRWSRSRPGHPRAGAGWPAGQRTMRERISGSRAESTTLK
jgi:hypothetical protein